MFKIGMQVHFGTRLMALIILLSTHADRHVVDISVTVCFFVSLSAGLW